MSEVRFACPVCGQHITADSSAVGAQVDCPSCFRKMVVPQGSQSGQNKLLLSAAQVTKPRPFSELSAPGARTKRRSALLDTLVSFLALLCIAAAASATIYWYQGKVKKTLPSIRSTNDPRTLARGWTLDPEKGLFPEGDVTGFVGGEKFHCDRATVKGTTLTLRQGKGRPSEMSVAIVLLQAPSAAPTLTVKPTATPPVPHVVVRRRNGQSEPASDRFRQGYLLNLACDPVSEGRIRGKLYLALPDEQQSYIAGNFDAEIVQPNPPPAPPAQDAQ